VQVKVVLKYGKYISNQMWWRFMAQACAPYMSSSKVQFAMGTTGLGILVAELLARFRTVQDVYDTSSAVYEKSIAWTRDGGAPEHGDDAVGGTAEAGASNTSAAGEDAKDPAEVNDFEDVEANPLAMQPRENINLHGDEMNAVHSPTSTGRNSVVAL